MSSHRDVVLGPHVSHRQRELLVSLMEEHPYLAKASCVLGPMLTVARRSELWNELAALLNMEGPAVKTAAQWRQYWKKETYSSRHDAAVLSAEQQGTGGGRLQGLCGRILTLVGRSSATGVCAPFFVPPEQAPHSAIGVPRVARMAVGTRPGTSGVARGEPQQQQQQQHREPQQRQEPQQLQPHEGPAQPAASLLDHEYCAEPPTRPAPTRQAHRPNRGPRVIVEEVMGEVAENYLQSVRLHEENNQMLRQLGPTVQQMAAAVERNAAAAERTAADAERSAAAAERSAAAAERAAAAAERTAAAAEQQGRENSV
ncbi:uncharacterized protein [Dermacentor albipictus]|uniref:uncharacterized protein n=1 Tax=Dermacentor albipictus TaxID=60249 RepID=UPI0038FC6CC3